MCCGRQLEAGGYSSVCPGCCVLVNLRVHVKPEKGKWLKKCSENAPREGGKEEAAWLTKQGVQDKRGQGAGKIEEEGGWSLQAFRVATILQVWGGLSSEPRHTNLQGKRSKTIKTGECTK